MAGYQRDHTAGHRFDLLDGGIGTKRVACGDAAWPHLRQGRPGPRADAQQPQPVAAEKQQRGARGARPQRRALEDPRDGQRHRGRGTARRVVTRTAGSAQGQVDGDAASDQHDGQARNQPSADRIAAIGITATMDNVEGRPVRHRLNVSATLAGRAAAGCPAAGTIERCPRTLEPYWLPPRGPGRDLRAAVAAGLGCGTGVGEPQPRSWSRQSPASTETAQRRHDRARSSDARDIGYRQEDIRTAAVEADPSAW